MTTYETFTITRTGLTGNPYEDDVQVTIRWTWCAGEPEVFMAGWEREIVRVRPTLTDPEWAQVETLVAALEPPEPESYEAPEDDLA